MRAFRDALMLGGILSVTPTGAQTAPPGVTPDARAWEGHHTASACGDGEVYGGIYRSRSRDQGHPTFDIDVSAVGGSRVRLSVTMRPGYRCALEGSATATTITFDPNQTCEVQVASSELCSLPSARCDSRNETFDCDDERRAGRLGSATLVTGRGTLTRREGGLLLEGLWRVSGCFLARGHNRNMPLRVTPRGGEVRLHACQ